MTITLDISPEAERRLQSRASKAGKPLPQLVADLVEKAAFTDDDAGASQDDQRRPGETNSAWLARIGILGSIASTPRADGRPWSEVEAACDPH